MAAVFSLQVRQILCDRRLLLLALFLCLPIMLAGAIRWGGGFTPGANPVDEAAVRTLTRRSDAANRLSGLIDSRDFPLGVRREVPVGLTDIALTFELDTDADAATVQRLVEISERLCVIYQTYAHRLDFRLRTGL